MSNINYNFNKLTPFRFFCLTNFPFIEEDFDSLTTYELLCKVVGYLNKVIDTTNAIGTQTEELTNAFNKLKSYVDNYFKNLDVQDEINNKLNEMAQSGELTEIIAQYLQLAGLLCFNTVNDLKNATNIVNGSFVKTYGQNSYNDGLGAFYKIRTITSSDVVDNYKIISLNINNTLIAERIFLSKKRCILIGDSYSVGVGATNGKGWSSYTKTLLEKNGYEVIILHENGSGFVRTGEHSNTFKTLLENNLNSISNKQFIDKIIVAGGCNDFLYLGNIIENAIKDFIAFCKNNFVNSKIYIGMIGNFSKENEISKMKFALYRDVLPAYTKCNKYGGIYLSGSENLNRNYSLFNDDNTHLSNYEQIGKGIFNIIENQQNTQFNSFIEATTNNNNLSKQIKMYTMQQDNIVQILIPQQIQIDFTELQTGNTIKLGEIKLENYRSSGGFNLLIPCEIALKLSDNSTHYSNANLSINYDNVLYLNIQNSIKFENIKTIALAGSSITLPSIYC